MCSCTYFNSYEPAGTGVCSRTVGAAGAILKCGNSKARKIRLYALVMCRFFVTLLMAIVTATLFLRTGLHPDSVQAGNTYFSVIFFSLISLMFDGFAEETLTVRTILTAVANCASVFMCHVFKTNHMVSVRLACNCLSLSSMSSLEGSLRHACMLQVARLDGWFKQRDNKMYPAWAYVLPTTLLRLPYSLAAAVLWCCIVYYPVGLAPEPGR